MRTPGLQSCTQRTALHALPTQLVRGKYDLVCGMGVFHVVNQASPRQTRAAAWRPCCLLGGAAAGGGPLASAPQGCVRSASHSLLLVLPLQVLRPFVIASG